MTSPVIALLAFFLAAVPDGPMPAASPVGLVPGVSVRHKAFKTPRQSSARSKGPASGLRRSSRRKAAELRRPWTLRELRNFRDAGLAVGLPPGRLFRSDDPRYRPFRACERLHAAGIRTIVKLNANQHRFRPNRRPHWRLGPCGLSELVVSIPYERTEGAHGANIYAIGRPRSRLQERRRVVAEMERHLGLAFRELARLRPEQLPMLVHCSVGRDRTGVVLALLTLAAGASPAEVERDYLASGPAVGNTSLVSLRRLLGRVGPTPAFLRRNLGLSHREIRKIRSVVRGPVPVAGT